MSESFCIKCTQKHNVKDCKTPSFNRWCRHCQVPGHILINCRHVICSKCGKEGHIERNCSKSPCKKCGLQTHKEEDCYIDPCSFCGSYFHYENECPNISIRDKQIIPIHQKYELNIVLPIISIKLCEPNYKDSEGPFISFKKMKSINIGW